MPILITFLAVLALLALIIGLKWHPFIALVLVAIGAGLALGMGPAGTMTAVTKGVGGTLGGLAIILGLGAVLGGIVALSPGRRRGHDHGRTRGSSHAHRTAHSSSRHNAGSRKQFKKHYNRLAGLSIELTRRVVD